MSGEFVVMVVLAVATLPLSFGAGCFYGGYHTGKRVFARRDDGPQVHCEACGNWVPRALAYLDREDGVFVCHTCAPGGVLP